MFGVCMRVKGAQSVTLLTVDNTLNGIIKGAIAESNPASAPYRNPETWEAMPVAFIVGAGCNPENSPDDILKCLRNRTSETLFQAQEYGLHHISSFKLTTRRKASQKEEKNLLSHPLGAGR